MEIHFSHPREAFQRYIVRHRRTMHARNSVNAKSGLTLAEEDSPPSGEFRSDSDVHKFLRRSAEGCEQHNTEILSIAFQQGPARLLSERQIFAEDVVPLRPGY